MAHSFVGTLRRRQKPDFVPPVQDNTFRLTCYIGGDRSPFSLSISGTTEVWKLKQWIQREGELDRSNLRILEVSFWKVCEEFDRWFESV